MADSTNNNTPINTPAFDTISAFPTDSIERFQLAFLLEKELDGEIEKLEAQVNSKLAELNFNWRL